jgi:hypothetical protein
MSHARRLVAAAAAGTVVLSMAMVSLSAVASASVRPRLDGHTCSQWTTHGTNRLTAVRPGAVICALGGNHTLSAGHVTGTVFLLARNGTNTLIGSSSRNSSDTLRADTGNATLIAGAGHDTLIGGSGRDHLIAKGGQTTLNAGSGTTWLVGGSGDDDMQGGSGSDSFTAGSGNDTIIFGSGHSTVNCGTSAGSVTVIGDDQGENENGDCHSGNVEQAQMQFSGTVTGISGAIITVLYHHASYSAHQWLSTNGNPTSVMFDTTSATITRIGGGPIQVGDHVRIEANAPTSGTTLIAVSVEASVVASQEWSGQVTGVSGAVITVKYFHVSDSAQQWLNSNGNPTSVMFDTTSATITRLGGGAIQVGDFVKVAANPPSSGTTLNAVAVWAFAIATQRWTGSVTNVAGSIITVQYTGENFAAHSWLQANGNPSTVDFDLTSATVNRVGGGSVQVGDQVFVESNPPSSGTTLLAVRVFAIAPATQLWAGKVTAVNGSVITVEYFFENGAAHTWLAANGNPATVDFDISTASVTRQGGGSIQVGDFVGVRSNPPSSGTTLVAVTVVAGTLGGDGDGH